VSGNVGGSNLILALQVLCPNSTTSAFLSSSTVKLAENSAG